MKILALKLSVAIFFACAFVLPCTYVNAADECSKELLLEYFPKQFVNETLKKYNVPQDKWDAITAALSAKDKDVVRIVEDKASKLETNPLKDRDPQQRQIAVKLFRETLLQVFSDSLQANGVSDNKQIQAMLDDIQQQKARNFAQCMEKQRAASQQKSESAPTEAVPSEGVVPTPQPAGTPEARLEGSSSADLVATNDDESGKESETEDDTEEKQY